MHCLYAIENPLMDYILHEDYSFLGRLDAAPGTMRLVSYETFVDIIAASRAHATFPGGSGANTVRGLAMLLGQDADRYGSPAYSGAIGPDDPGACFVRILESLGIDLALAEKEIPTGVSAIVITPDHDRTMFTYTGACNLLGPENLSQEFLADARYLYLTGYLWESGSCRAAIMAATETARLKGATVCFDLSDPFIVDQYYESLRS